MTIVEYHPQLIERRRTGVSEQWKQLPLDKQAYERGLQELLPASYQNSMAYGNIASAT